MFMNGLWLADEAALGGRPRRLAPVAAFAGRPGLRPRFMPAGAAPEALAARCAAQRFRCAAAIFALASGDIFPRGICISLNVSKLVREYVTSQPTAAA